jgi:single-strand DNA-binding protein
MTYQSVTIVGRLGKDPEMRYTPSGSAVTSFSIATDHQYTGSDGQKVKETMWFRISAWGKQAETCNQYLKKGSMVLVEGRLTGDKNGGPRVWTDKEGNPRASFEVSASTVRFLSSKAESEALGSAESSGDVAPDEIPF